MLLRGMLDQDELYRSVTGSRLASNIDLARDLSKGAQLQPLIHGGLFNGS
jgi:hypothetical protein